jgi:hypothetical protein
MGDRFAFVAGIVAIVLLMAIPVGVFIALELGA